MDVALFRANVLKSNNTTMDHFLHELNKDIQDAKELYHYTSRTRVEAQQKRRLTSKKTYPSGPIKWRERITQKGPKSKEGKFPNMRVKRAASNNIKYFKCLGKGHIALQFPNKKRMIL
ncbi:hypothetical protein CR513_36963, partial [Mucuna pruriens]